MTYQILTDDILAQTSGGKKKSKNNKWLKWECPVGTIGTAISGGAAGPVGFFVGSVAGSVAFCE